MTVGELILKLKEYPDETPIKIESLEHIESSFVDDGYKLMHQDVGVIDKVSGILVIRLA